MNIIHKLAESRQKINNYEIINVFTLNIKNPPSNKNFQMERRFNDEKLSILVSISKVKRRKL